MDVKQIMKRNEMIETYGGFEKLDGGVETFISESEIMLADETLMFQLLNYYNRRIDYYKSNMEDLRGRKLRNSRYDMMNNIGKNKVDSQLNYYSDLIDVFFNKNNYVSNLKTNESVINQVLENINIMDISDFDFIESNFTEENHKHRAYIYVNEKIGSKYYVRILINGYMLDDYKPIALKIYIERDYIKNKFPELDEVLSLNMDY